MYTILARNVNEAVAQALPYLIEHGEREESRNGAVLVAKTPVMTVYSQPCERVLYSATRDANPFFHLMESLWMLAGRNDAHFPALFNKRFTQYSDNGVSVHGAYGFRWRSWFGNDQLLALVNELKERPNSRRAVLQMWAPLGDLFAVPLVADDGGKTLFGGLTSKDVPCNTNAYFDLRGGKLNMTVCCRSNDVIWGAYGANAVHFSVLLEYLAAHLGVEVGLYYQFSNNFHAYTDVYDINKLSRIGNEAAQDNYYSLNAVKPYPLVSSSIEAWDEDLATFMKEPLHKHTYNDKFFSEVVYPMFLAWAQRKSGVGNGLGQIECIAAEDWKLACIQWVAHREAKH